MSNEPEAAARGGGPPRGRIPAWIIGLALAAAVAIFFWRHQIHSFGYYRDAALYLSGALGLAQGEGYRLTPYAGAPAIGQYPPLQSLYLAPFVRLGGGGLPELVPWVNGGMILLAVAAALAGWQVMRRLGTPAWLAGLLALNLAVAMRWFEWTFWLMSDIGFTALLLGLAAWVLARPAGAADRRLWPVTGLVLATAYLWRSAALGAIAGAGLLAAGAAWRGRSWRPLLALGVPCLLAGLGWWLWSRQALGYGDLYAVWIEQAGGGPRGYARFVLLQTGELLSGRALWEAVLTPLSRLPLALGRTSPAAAAAVSAAGFVLAAAAAGAAVFGLLRSPRRRELAVVFTGLCYLGFVLLVPNGPEHVHRYLFPVLPAFLGLAVRGAAGLVPARWRPAAGGLAAAALLAAVAANAAMSLRAAAVANAQFALDELREVADWARTNTPPEARIAVDYALPVVHFHLWSGRRIETDMGHPGAGTSLIRTDLIGQTNAAYTLVSDQGFAPYRPAGGFEEVKVSSGGRFRLFRRPDPPAR